MTDEARRLLELALLLAPRERVELAARLVASVHALDEIEAAWDAEVAARAAHALEGELGRVHYLGRAPVPLRFDAGAELDLERAVSWYAGEPRRIDALLAALTEAIDRIHAGP